MKNPTIPFSPLHGLASLGAGGLAISFFVWLMVLVPLGGLPVPTADSLSMARQNTDLHGLINFLVAMIALLAVAHYGLLAWWLRRGRTACHSPDNLYDGESHILKMITPLVLAMSINVAFVLGLVFVPGLWTYKEWLFPFALIGFASLLVLALNRWKAQRLLVQQHRFSYQGKGLIELLAAFALGMITVGFSASAAMSEFVLWHSLGLILALVSATAAFVAAIDVIRTRADQLSNHPLAAASTGSLLMGVPILTVLGIAAYRLLMAGNHHFGLSVDTWVVTLMFGVLFIAQVLIFLYATPKIARHGGWQTLVQQSPQGASFSLICPGVGFFVLGMFLVSKGLLGPELIGSTLASGLYGLLAVIQITTIGLFVYLLLYAMPTQKCKLKPARNDILSQTV